MLQQGIVLESMYTVGFIVIGLLINKIGKFPIICKYKIWRILDKLLDFLNRSFAIDLKIKFLPNSFHS